MVNFTNTIIILTSNLGSELFTEGQKKEEREKAALDAVKKFFRPEFINRLDSMVIFNPLDQEMIGKIVDKELSAVAHRLKKQNLDFEASDALKKHLRVIGFDPVYGARPLRRIVNEVIVDEIALQIVEGKIKPLDKVIADIKMGKVVITVKKPS